MSHVGSHAGSFKPKTATVTWGLGMVWLGDGLRSNYLVCLCLFGVFLLGGWVLHMVV